jgi:TPR repeat protein
MSNLGAVLTRWNPPDLRGARFWLEKAAATGDPNVMTSLGILLFRVMDPPDPHAARAWLEKAAAAGQTGAMRELDLLANESR